MRKPATIEMWVDGLYICIHQPKGVAAADPRSRPGPPEGLCPDELAGTAVACEKVAPAGQFEAGVGCL
jgi:hypothetical protein